MAGVGEGSGERSAGAVRKSGTKNTHEPFRSPRDVCGDQSIKTGADIAVPPMAQARPVARVNSSREAVAYLIRYEKVYAETDEEVSAD